MTCNVSSGTLSLYTTTTTTTTVLSLNIRPVSQEIYFENGRFLSFCCGMSHASQVTFWHSLHTHCTANGPLPAREVSSKYDRNVAGHTYRQTGFIQVFQNKIP